MTPEFLIKLNHLVRLIENGPRQLKAGRSGGDPEGLGRNPRQRRRMHIDLRPVLDNAEFLGHQIC